MRFISLYLILKIINFVAAFDESSDLYKVLVPQYICHDSDATECSLIEMNFPRLKDFNHLTIPEASMQNVIFKKVLHWEVKGTFLTEFTVDDEHHFGYIIMLYGTEAFGFGFMEFDGNRFNFRYSHRGQIMLLNRWQLDSHQQQQSDRRSSNIKLQEKYVKALYVNELINSALFRQSTAGKLIKILNQGQHKNRQSFYEIERYNWIR